jgi:hypothetical protein
VLSEALFELPSTMQAQEHLTNQSPTRLVPSLTVAPTHGTTSVTRRLGICEQPLVHPVPNEATLQLIA